MKFEESLNEAFKRYKLTYKGTQKNYKINDPFPYVLSIDNSYNVDGKGESILGVNLNYYNGDLKKLISQINKADNEAGFTGFDTISKIKKKISKDKEKVEDWEVSKRKERYNNFISEFPHMGKFIRRYKIRGPQGSGIQNKKRVIKK